MYAIGEGIITNRDMKLLLKLILIEALSNTSLQT